MAVDDQVLVQRLEVLQKEYRYGQQRFAALQREVAALQTTLLHLEGAMLVIEELVEPEGQRPQTQTLSRYGSQKRA